MSRQFNSAQLVLAEMIELDLQQAWELLDTGNFAGGIHHFEAAISKTKEMEAAGTVPSEASMKQLTIDIP